MGLSLSKKLGVRKVARTLLGKKASRLYQWGYVKKKLGLHKIFRTPFSASSYQANSSSVYGHTGSIVGRF